jgi:hypothetical protein
VSSLRGVRYAAHVIPGLLIATLGACAKGDYATVTIGYQSRSQSSEWNLEPSAKQRVGAAFKRTAEAQGYKCNERGKRLDEITCAGPKRMNVVFQPELNRPEFTAHFNWVEWHGRTREEFDGHIRKFAAAMTSAVPEARVVVSDERDPHPQ